MVARPTAALPPLKTQPTYEQLGCALSLVEHLYATFPATQLFQSSNAAPGCDDDDDGDGHDDNGGDDDAAVSEDDDVLRASDLERQWALSWALRLSGSFLDWIEPGDAEHLHNRAAKVVADAACIADEGALDRDFVFPLASLDRTWAQLGLAPPRKGTLAFESGSDKPANGSAAGKGVGTAGAEATNGGQLRTAKPDTPDGTLARTWSITLRDEALPPATSQEGGQATTEEAIASRAQDAATAVGLQTWAAAVVLCDYLARFWVPRCERGRQVRILELGAGTGLAGLLAGKVALDRQDRREHCGVQTILTDYHEKVLENLLYNIELNTLAAAPDVRPDVLDWAEVNEYVKDQAGWAARAVDSPPPWWVMDAQDGGYDLVLGADVMYSPEHAMWLASCLAAMIPASSARLGAEGHILCAVRDKGRFAAMHLIDSADRIFREATAPDGAAAHLHLAATHRIPKVHGLGRADERGWVHWIFRRRPEPVVPSSSSS